MGWTDNELAEMVRRAMAEHREQRGEHVRALRRARGWSREDLAHEAGVSPKTIYRFETGQIMDARNATIAGIAKALGIPESDVRGEPPSLPIPDAAEQLDRIEAITTEILELARRLLENGGG